MAHCPVHNSGPVFLGNTVFVRLISMADNIGTFIHL